MRGLLPIICVSATSVLFAGCDRNSSVAVPLETATAVTGKGSWIIQYDVSGNLLSYAVIDGPFLNNKGEEHVVSGGCTSDGRAWVYLRRPDGSKTPILGTGRIFFVSGTNVTECPQAISGRTFQAFLDCHPADYSMPTLLEFASGKTISTNQMLSIAVEPTATAP
jgi:hypothetical protein